MGLSRNKVAVPEGVAGTPPFWSEDLTIDVREKQYGKAKCEYFQSFCSYYGARGRDSGEFIDNTERKD